MGTLSMVVKARKPTRLLSQPWAAYAAAYARNPRLATFEDCYVDPFARAVLLKQKVDPGSETTGRAGYTLRIFTGGSWQAIEDVWTEGEGAFGDAGTYVSFAGNATYPITTPWEAYRSLASPLAPYQPMYFQTRWVPPPGNFLPQLQFWPRVDTTHSGTFFGNQYYFAPLGFYIDATSGTLVVCEYEHDDYDAFDSGWASALTATYSHPLDLGVVGLFNGWMQFDVIPVPEKWTDAKSVDDEDDPPDVFYRDDFVVQSPMLRNGGFLYRTKIPRKTLSLFPVGSPGMRSLTGGITTLMMAPLYVADTGYTLSEVYTKREADTRYPTVTDESHQPPATLITHEVVHPATNVEIVVGETFEEFRVKSTLNAAGGGTLQSPILYRVKASFVQEALTPEQDEVDISADVSIAESFSDDLTGYKATVTLRNRDGVYNDLVYRPLNEITFEFGGVQRGVLYTLDPSFQWWQTPTEEALILKWQCGNFWERMKGLHIAGHPDYGNQSIKEAIRQYMVRIGFEPSAAEIAAGATTRLQIADSLANIYLPYSPSKNDPLCKPRDGDTAEKFIADLREKYFSTHPAAFNGAGDFVIAEPLNPSHPSSISRTFYLSHTAATSAYDTYGGDWNDYTYVCREPTVTWLHSQHRNAIYVVGVDPATQAPLIAFWEDVQSQTDEDYLYYVGERRLLIATTRLPTQPLVDLYLLNLKKVFWAIRRQISFTTKYDPYLMPGDFIMFWGWGLVFQVTSITDDISAANVTRGGTYDSTYFDNDSTYYDNTVENCRVDAIQWPLT